MGLEARRRGVPARIFRLFRVRLPRHSAAGSPQRTAALLLVPRDGRCRVLLHPAAGGKTASAEQAEEIHAHIRATLAAKYGNEVADNCTILYGGSCNAGNAKELFAKPNVDGGLIGGASLAVDKFMPIIEAF